MVRTRRPPARSSRSEPRPAPFRPLSSTLIHQSRRRRPSGFWTKSSGCSAALAIDALTLSGSSPAPATHGLYSDLIALALARPVPVFLDTYGPALDGIWGFWPTSIQLNRREAAIRLRKTSVSDDDVGALLQEWHRRGVTCGIVTDGPNPVAILYRGRRYRAFPPKIEVVNPIGSGDSLLAGLVDGWLNRLEPEPLFRHAIACAVANALVWDAGAIEPGEVALE